MEETIKVKYDSVLPQIILPGADFPGGKRFDQSTRGEAVDVSKSLGESLIRSGHFKPVAATIVKKKEGGDK